MDRLAVTFIGEHFGYDADNRAFDVLWTGTRTGVSELLFSRVETDVFDPPAALGGIVAEILAGVIPDGGAVVFVDGHCIRFPARGPIYDPAQAVAALDAARKISGPTGRALTKDVYEAIGAIAKSAGRALQR